MLKVEIISVEGLVFEGSAHQVVVPTISGEIGFMEDHESMLCELKEGLVCVLDSSDSKVKEVEVKAGVAEMHEGGKLVILINE